MEDASVDHLLKKLINLIGCGSLAALGPALGISSQAVYDAKKRNKIPARWLTIAAKKYGIDSREFYSEEEDRCRTKSAGEVEGGLFLQMQEQYVKKLEIDLEREREERRELAAENRRLWKENAALREENATLRERQRKDEQVRLFDERKDFHRNDVPLQRSVPGTECGS